MRGFKNSRQFMRNNKPVNESLTLLAAGSLISCMFGAVFGGGFLGLGNLFNWGGKDNDSEDSKDSKDSDSNDEKDDTPSNEENSKNFLGMLDMAKKNNQEEKDKTAQKENDQYLKLLVACSFDEKGEEIPFDQRAEKMKDALPEGTDFDEFKSKMQEKYNAVKDDENFKKQLQEQAASYKVGNYEELLNSTKEEAKKTWTEVKKEKETQQSIDAELANISVAIQNGTATDEQKKRLEELSKTKDDMTKNGSFGVISTPNGGPGSVDDDEDVKKADEELTKAKSELSTSEARDKEIQEKLKGLDVNSDEFKNLTKEKEDLTTKIEDQKKAVTDAEEKAKKAREEAKKKLETPQNDDTGGQGGQQNNTGQGGGQGGQGGGQGGQGGGQGGQGGGQGGQGGGQGGQGGTTPPKPKDDDKGDMEVGKKDLGKDAKLTPDEEKEVQAAGAKGAPQPHEPRMVVKRKLKRGKGVTYCYKDDRDQTLAPHSKEYKDAIKAVIKYRKALALWKKNNPKEAFDAFYKPICEWFKEKLFLI